MSDKLEALSRLGFDKWMMDDYSPDHSPAASEADEKAFQSLMWHVWQAAQLPLLAALEEKDQQIKELEEFAKLALEKIPNEKSSPDFYIVGNGPCFLAYPESMGPEARGDLAGNLRKAYLSPTHWKERAKSAEQRLELVREQRDNELRTNSELEQRLQQPIKLPDRYSVDCGVVCDPNGDWLSLDDVIKVLADAGVEVRSPCPRCNRLLDLTSRPDGAHYCHHKGE